MNPIFDADHRERARSARVSMALFRISQAIKKITQVDSDEAGLSPVQVQSLLFVYHTRGDMATPGQLAQAIGASHVTAVKLINGLLDKGLLLKEKSEQDKRVTFLSLTEKGREVIEGLDSWGNRLEQAVSLLPEEVMANLEVGLGGIIHALQQQGVVMVAEPCRGCMHFRPDQGPPETPHYCAMVQGYLSDAASRKECPEHTKPIGP